MGRKCVLCCYDKEELESFIFPQYCRYCARAETHNNYVTTNHKLWRNNVLASSLAFRLEEDTSGLRLLLPDVR